MTSANSMATRLHGGQVAGEPDKCIHQRKAERGKDNKANTFGFSGHNKTPYPKNGITDASTAVIMPAMPMARPLIAPSVSPS